MARSNTSPMTGAAGFHRASAQWPWVPVRCHPAWLLHIASCTDAPPDMLQASEHACRATGTAELAVLTAML